MQTTGSLTGTVSFSQMKPKVFILVLLNHSDSCTHQEGLLIHWLWYLLYFTCCLYIFHSKLAPVEYFCCCCYFFAVVPIHIVSRCTRTSVSQQKATCAKVFQPVKQVRRVKPGYHVKININNGEYCSHCPSGVMIKGIMWSCKVLYSRLPSQAEHVTAASMVSLCKRHACCTSTNDRQSHPENFLQMWWIFLPYAHITSDYINKKTDSHESISPSSQTWTTCSKHAQNTSDRFFHFA